jgi:hypothetical protein
MNIISEIIDLKNLVKKLKHLTFLHKIVTGSSVQSGDGAGTEFTIAHGLGSEPSYVSVQAGSEDAVGAYHLTVDATNITVVYTVAPILGIDNLTFYWSAKK